MADQVGAVMVVGSGVGGIQSALNLAESGFKVYLVDEKPSIGGTMSKLDKTFPTNDCSMCILAPKMVDAARHPNIELLAYTDVVSVEGEEGNFSVKLNKKARYVDEDKCVACGDCATVCRLKGRISHEFNHGLNKRGAVYVPFPQAVPLTYTIDPNTCLFLKNGKCGEYPPCKEACKAEAIDHDQKDEMLDINVGSIVVATGLEPFDPKKKPEYGYGRFENVITTLELERLLNASGPTEGHVTRPSDGEEAKKVAFIQCVGSRDQRTNSYCSGVCCMYALKKSILVNEHNSEVESHIYAMDVRTFGRGFEDYRARAEEQYNVTIYKNSRVPSVEETDNSNLLIQRIVDGKIVEEEYDMVVLTVGIEPAKGTAELAGKLGIDLNEHGFCKTDLFEPLSTSKPGIFTCGASSGPKDIPETVAQSSGASAKASSVITAKRNELVTEKVYPEEKKVAGEKPRIGVFICHCGTNIAGVVDVKAVSEYAKTLPNVEFSTDTVYTCSQDAQNQIKEIIKEHDLNRIVISSCSPRTHEPLFQDTIREAGLNPYLFDMANIRDQCSWVHAEDPEKATEKSKILTRMSIARAALLQPLTKTTVDMKDNALVIGGGLAGITAALEMSKQGYRVDLIEKTDHLGGHMSDLPLTLENEDPQAHLKLLIQELEADKNITVHTNVTLKNMDGYMGNFTSALSDGNTLEHGCVIVATGGTEYAPTEYLYGKNPNVMKQLEFEEKMAWGKINPRSVAIMHCVGARNEDNPECGRICCGTSIKTSLDVKKRFPDAQVYNLFKDVRTYGFREQYYKKASEDGVVFVEYDDEHKPAVTEENEKIKIEMFDRILGQNIVIRPDFLVLSAAIVANDDNKDLAKVLKVPLGKDGFFLEAHVKLRPLDFATDGIYLCGMAHGPKFMDETISQACGAVARACTVLSKGKVAAGGMVSIVDEELCGGCGTCETVCPYGAIAVDHTDPTNLKAQVKEVLCKSCGTCVAACPERAISAKHFTDEQILAQIHAMTEEV